MQNAILAKNRKKLEMFTKHSVKLDKDKLKELKSTIDSCKSPKSPKDREKAIFNL